MLPHLSSLLIPGGGCCQNRGKCQDVCRCKADKEEANCWDRTVVLCVLDILKLWYCVSLMHVKFGIGAVVLCELDVLEPH